MWNFWVGIPQKPFKWGQLAPSPSSSPSLVLSILHLFLQSCSPPFSLCSGSRRLTCMEPISKYPCPLNFSKRWSLEGQRNQNFFSGLPLCQATRGQWLLPSVKGHSSSQADISDHYSCSSRWIPATIPCPYPFTLRSGNASLLLLTPGFLIIPCSFPFTLPTPL